MYTKQEIVIKSHREGQSQRSIARELGISRKTVKKYIEEYEGVLRESSGEGGSALSQYLIQAPVYKGSKRPKRRLTIDVQAAIDKLLEQNEQNRLKGMRKQMLKKIDIHSAVVAQGYDIGYTTVCTYISEKQKKPGRASEAFIRQQYQPGESCEFDWGLVKLEIDGKVEQVQMSVFTSGYSNYRYAMLYRCQDTLAFQESHVSFFAYSGVVFKEMLYDNMRVAIAKFVGRSEKEPTQALLQLRAHYQFTHRFCNFYRGNEKGHVERSVEYIRRKAFGLKNSFATLEEATEWLLCVIERLNRTAQQLTGKTAEELFGEEKALLPPATEKMLCSRMAELKVDKYATVSYKNNRYSVPDHLVGRYVNVRISSHHLRIYEDNQLIAEHSRHFGVREWVISIEHYLETFRRKPGALAGSVALAGRLRLKALYHDHFEEDVRSFIDLLAYCQKHHISDEELEEAVNCLRVSGLKEITTERLTAILGNRCEEAASICESTTTRMAQLQLEKQAALFFHN